LFVVRIYPEFRHVLRIDSLFRTLTDYMVSRKLLAAILSLPYPWFDFFCDRFYADLTDFQSAGQPSASAVSRFPFRIGGINICPCSSLSSSLRSRGIAIPGKRFPFPLAQDCMHIPSNALHSMYLHLYQKHCRHEGWQWPTSVLCTCNCSRWERLEVRWYRQPLWPFPHDLFKS
jgi:hypothetical protein